jgi:hypothetical protein
MAGSRKGVPNQPKRALLALLNEKYPGYHPILEMAAIANDTDVDLAMRAGMHKEIAQYVVPKLKAVETTGEVSLDVRIGWGNPHSIQSEAITEDPA